LSTPFRLEIPGSSYEEIVQQALAEKPNECCGMLAGRLLQSEPPSIIRGRVERRYPLANVKANPQRYEVDPLGLVRAFKDMRGPGLRELAFYHSHPTSEPVPSKTDLAENSYGDSVIHLIVSLAVDPPLMRGWWLREDSYAEAEFVLVDG
jgi:[CysO sulfur-carrier protein]-S-L-cysteine hydrolase